MGEVNPRTIIVAVDEGDHSMFALEWALDTLLLRRQANDRIIILYAKPAYSTLNGPAFVLTTDAIESIERYQNQIASEVIDSAKQICAEREVYPEAQIMVGDPRDVIQETVDKLKADFLVIGSHGFGALKRAILGSVSDYCAHNVKCPVVIVRKTHQ